MMKLRNVQYILSELRDLQFEAIVNKIKYKGNYYSIHISKNAKKFKFEEIENCVFKLKKYLNNNITNVEYHNANNYINWDLKYFLTETKPVLLCDSYLCDFIINFTLD